MNAIFTQIQSIKSSLIDTVALIYAIGLSTWSIHAYDHSLGIISAFDTQYFIGGVFPFLILLFLYYAITNNFTFIYNIYKWIRIRQRKFRIENPEKYKRRIRIRAFIYLLLPFALFGYLTVTEKSWFAAIIALVYLSLMIYAFRSGSTLGSKKPISIKVFRRFYYLFHPVKLIVNYTKFVIAFFSAILLLVYSLSLYPKIPQELGGAKPKLCVFECKKNLYHPESVGQLFVDTTQSVLKSHPALVYYYNADKFIIKTSKYSDTWEINRKDITMIQWQ